MDEDRTAVLSLDLGDVFDAAEEPGLAPYAEEVRLVERLGHDELELREALVRGMVVGSRPHGRESARSCAARTRVPRPRRSPRRSGEGLRVEQGGERPAFQRVSLNNPLSSTHEQSGNADPVEQCTDRRDDEGNHPGLSLCRRHGLLRFEGSIVAESGGLASEGLRWDADEASKRISARSRGVWCRSKSRSFGIQTSCHNAS